MDLEAVQEIEVDVEETGLQGYSAYEVAVQNGFEGTEVEWLASLKGADGQDGANGRDGQDGQDGITPTIGDNGNWYLGTTDTGKPSRGATGETGATGQDGQDGQDGYSPTATVTQSSGVTTISITDKNGTTSESIDLSGYYSKPSGGIPSTDLSRAVQTSLGKADTAIQDISGKQDVLTAGNNITIQNNVISAAGGASYTAGEGIDITNDIISAEMPIYVITDNSSSNPFVIEEQKKGIYTFGAKDTIYMKGTTAATVKTTLYINGGLVLITDDSPIDSTSQQFKLVGYVYGACGYFDGYNSIYSCAIIVWPPNGMINTSNVKTSNHFIGPTTSEIISGTHTYTTLPESSVVPTTNNQFVNKKYVDDSIAAAITTTLGGSY